MLSSEMPVSRDKFSSRRNSSRDPPGMAPPSNVSCTDFPESFQCTNSASSGNSNSKNSNREKLRLMMPKPGRILPPFDVASPTKRLKQLFWQHQNQGPKSNSGKICHQKTDAGPGSGSGSGSASNSSVDYPNWNQSQPRIKSQFPRYSEEHDPSVPKILVNSGGRRVSISSQLRFTRTFSTDSIDSIEKLCLKEFRRQQMLMDDETKNQKHMPPTSLLSPTHSNYPTLRNVGRSKTDPGNDAEGSTPGGNGNAAKQPVACQSFDCSKLGVVMDNTLKRSNPEIYNDGSKTRTLKDLIGITSYQEKLLLQCWPNIYSTGTSGNFASQVYSNLSARNQKAKTILTKANGVSVFKADDTGCTSLHVKLTLELIDTIIKSLDLNPTTIVSYLTEIGQSHKTLKDEGMSMAMWDDFGDAILDGVRKNDLVRRHKELRRAWLAIIAFITDNIKQGHQTFRASPSSNEINDQKKKEIES